MAAASSPTPHSAHKPPVIIAGAGVCGLLLAQYLRKSGVAFRIFERDTDLATRGLGWGLTLHWSLTALRTLLPEELVRRLPEAYADRAAVANGQASAFPFYDLATVDRVSAAPFAPEARRIRVTRDGFRRILATSVDIEWGKAVSEFETSFSSSQAAGRDSDSDGKEEEVVTVHFDDGSSCTGSLLVACDGARSRVRRALFAAQPTYQIPIRVLGLRVDCTPDQIAPLRTLDPFFLQGTSSVNDTYVYFSILDAPGNHGPEEGVNKYSLQVVVSWPIRAGYLGHTQPIPVPATDAEGIALIKTFASTWADPFRAAVLDTLPLEDDEEGVRRTQVKSLDLHDWAPPSGFRTTGRVALVGDAFHPMSMYRGEGANHAIVDCLELVNTVIAPHFVNHSTEPSSMNLRTSLDRYEDTVVSRTRPAVLASRQACIDAHEWGRIKPESPLLSRRAMMVDFDEEKDLYLPW